LEWASVKAGRHDQDPDFARGLPSVKDLEVFLAKERDGLSWQQIATKHFPDCTRRSKAAGMSTSRRAHKRIEDAIAPPKRKYIKMLLDSRIEELFGVKPETFKKYLRSK